MRLDDLVLAVQAGEPRAWTLLGQRLTTDLERYFRRRIGSSDAADDLVQLTLMVVHRKLASFRVEAGRPFERWVYRIARLQLLEAARQQHRQDRLAGALSLVGGTPGTSVGTSLDRGRRFGLVEQELAKLDGRYRRAILNDLQGGDAGTLAQQEQIERTSARSRRRRAQQMLRSLVRARGGVTVATT